MGGGGGEGRRHRASASRDAGRSVQTAIHLRDRTPYNSNKCVQKKRLVTRPSIRVYHPAWGARRHSCRTSRARPSYPRPTCRPCHSSPGLPSGEHGASQLVSTPGAQPEARPGQRPEGGIGPKLFPWHPERVRQAVHATANFSPHDLPPSSPQTSPSERAPATQLPSSS